MMKRIIIIGCGGAGKSTLARELGTRLGLPVHPLDRWFWRPGWVPTPRDEWTQIQTQLCAAPAWIIEGNYGGTMDIRLAACDTVIFLDYPRCVCLWRVTKRLITYRNRVRPDMTEGCPERITWEFLRWIWNYRSKYRPSILNKLAQLESIKSVYHLPNLKTTRSFLHQIH